MLETDLPFVSLWVPIGGEYAEGDGGWEMTAGDPPRSALIASEPLTMDYSTWLEAPEYPTPTLSSLRTGSRSRRAPSMSYRETVDFLAIVPLLQGRYEVDLAELGASHAPADGPEARSSGTRGTMRRRCCSSSIGALGFAARSGGRAVEIGRAGPGEVVG